MHTKSAVYQVLISFIVLLTMTESAYAYLDPGTGSMILQGLIAAIAIGIATVKMWWYRVTSFFTNKAPDSDLNEEDSTED